MVIIIVVGKKKKGESVTYLRIRVYDVFFKVWELNKYFPQNISDSWELMLTLKN